MATNALAKPFVQRAEKALLRSSSKWQCALCRHQQFAARGFRSTNAKSRPNSSDDKGPFRVRLRKALKDTKTQWYSIPIGVGIGSLGVLQVYRIQRREYARAREEEERLEEEGHGGQEADGTRPKKRKRIRPSGPWQVQVMSTLPLKALSRVWGRFNELEIPYYLRVPGFKLYSWIFGADLSEVSEPDLHVYPNLASFFYRTLKPGSRVIDSNPLSLTSPADGRVLQMGIIEKGEIEQIKGMTYSLDALLGSHTSGNGADSKAQDEQQQAERSSTADVHKADEEFARLNGISYTLPNLFSGPNPSSSTPRKGKKTMDASTTPRNSSIAEVRADLALGDGTETPWYYFGAGKTVPRALYYVVIYLAPGDYHRFHSPTAWVAEKRRHFAGELYSVSPYLQRTLPGLFTLNERVVLLGRWRWGFFSFTPVGATNVGSIKINFDRELRTNSLTTDTEADRAAEEAAKRGEAYSGYAEATYAEASSVLGGHALKKGEEMGGFQLGSSIVLVFEAPQGLRKTFDEGWEGGVRKGGWRWNVEQGQRIKMGEPLGYVDDSYMN
ncbi:phosphatidylserine decarboxylase 1 [Agyrium rufum]|nr:phosphatidylserine decarboxylase 1 [Agyrium rufum]